MTVAEIIKSHRKEKNLTQIELAQKSGVPISSLQRYESGTAQVPIDRFIELLNVMGIEVTITLSERVRV